MALPDDVVAVGEGFWNLRGTFRVGPLDIGTQSSLVALEGGGHLLLDGCELSAAAQRWLDAQTDSGSSIEAVLHLHPFHTVFVKQVHERYPGAALFGTRRHHAKAPELPWEALTTDDPALHERFGADLEFTVPAGVAFIPSDEHLHFASVLAIHRRSRTLHVDDTLMAFRLPRPVRWLKRDIVRFHPTLSRVLEPRAGAAADFRAWARTLARRCREVDNLCAAHSAALLRRGPFEDRVEHALAKVEGALRAHERRHGVAAGSLGVDPGAG